MREKQGGGGEGRENVGGGVSKFLHSLVPLLSLPSTHFYPNVEVECAQSITFNILWEESGFHTGVFPGRRKHKFVQRVHARCI